MDKNEYQKVRRAVLGGVNSNDFMRIFGRGPDIKDAINIMITGLDEIVRGSRSGVSQNMYERVERGTKHVMEYVIYKKIDKFGASFALAYTDLLTMWNKELGYNVDFDIMADAIRSIVRSHLTINESIDVLRSLLMRAERYLQYEPPAYKISRHFLHEVLDNIEKDYRPLNEGKKGGN